MNPKNKKEFKLLTDAVKESRRKMGVFRDNRKNLISMFCGSEYSDDAEAKTVYLNLINMATNIYVRQCAARTPTARVITPIMELRPIAKNFSLACEKIAEEVDLGIVFRRAVTDALFSPMTTCKVALKHRGTKDMYGEELPVTSPYVKLVSFDDYVRDMSARSAYDPEYQGDTYYLSKEQLLKNYPAAKSMGLTKDDLGTQDDEGNERAETISHSIGLGEDELTDKIAVQDIYLIKQKLMVTYILSKPEKPLAVIEWDGSCRGPYFNLWFADVLDNAMPSPPLSHLKNIHELANSLYRRMSSQARKHKRVVAFRNKDDAARFSNTRDGDGTYWDGTKPEQLEAGGVDQRVLGMFIQTKDMFSWAAGNLDSLGGLSPMSSTASQDKMLSESASTQIRTMQESVTRFAQDVFREIAWYEWTDPVRERRLYKPVTDTDIFIPVKWSRETKMGEFIDFNFSIIPQSMQEDTPSSKINKLNTIMMQMILPLMPVFEKQGLSIDARKWLGMIADYSNLPELESMLIAQEPADPDIQGNPNPTPANTTRTYERVNRPGATRVGKEMPLIQTLMGGGAQPSEAAAMTRSVG